MHRDRTSFLSTQLASLGATVRFYAAEIVGGVGGLHGAGVVYGDLRPDNILITADGHVVLADVGLYMEFLRHSAPRATCVSVDHCFRIWCVFNG